MKKLILLLLIALSLTGCSSVDNHDMYYSELVYKYFDTEEYTINQDTIKISINNDMEYEEIVARTNLMLKEINTDTTIKIYQYKNFIPTIITLYKSDDNIQGYKFN